MYHKVCKISVLLAMSALFGNSVSAQVAYSTFSPSEKPLFFGSAPFATVPGSMAMEASGTVKKPFLSRKVTWARTGKSTQDAEVSGTWGAIKIPSGTRFYAMPFKDGYLSQQKKFAEQGIKIAEVAWCTPDVKPKKAKPYCFFIDLSGQLRHATSGAGSPYFPEYMGINGYNNIFDEPKIVEGPVDFGNPLTMEVQIKKISRKTIKYEIKLFDGAKRSDIFSDKVERAKDGTVRISIWGGELEITPSGKKSFEVREVSPILENVSPEDEKLIPPYALRT